MLEQIVEALKHVEYMVLVLTPGAIASDIVRKEWRQAVSASRDNTFKVWDLASGTIIASFSGEAGFISCVVAPDGKTIVAGDQGGRVYFLRLENF